MGDKDNRWPNLHPGRKLVWMPKAATSDVVNEKMLSAFGYVKSFRLKRIIIQFWRPVKITGGNTVLASNGNPYALPRFNRPLLKYVLRCSHYCYGLDYRGKVVDDDPMTITGAPPSTAFYSHSPEVVLDLRVHRGTPLVDLALECELTCFVMLPLFYENRCVGVVEVSARRQAHLVAIFCELAQGARRVGLVIIPPLVFMLPCKVKLINNDLKLASSEIEKALQVAVKSHAITLGQVWLPYETCHMLLLHKLNMYCDHLSSSLQHFYNVVVRLLLKKGEGLIGRTFETRQPHLCRNIHKLSDNNRGLLALLSNTTKCASFVLCLRSSHTGELNYVFEFFWPQSHNHLALMEDLLLTLREHLPSFKYASGAQLGDELPVVDVETSSSGSGSGSTNVKISPVKKLSKTRASARLKRKSIEGQSDQLNQANPEGEDDNDDDDDDDDLVIIAVYKVDYRLFFLPSSTAFKSFMEEINKEFDLNPTGTYKIDYQVVPGEWHGLTDATCLKRCISSYRTSKNTDHIKLYVQALQNI